MPQGLQDFWRVYEAHYDAIQKRTAEVAREHPVFGPLVASMSAADQEAQAQRSRALLASAIGGDWEPYLADLRKQGEGYARMGIGFGDWYDMTRIFSRELVPRLVEKYGGDAPRLTGSIEAMQEFIDRAMAELSKAYLAVKQEVALAQRLRLFVDSVQDYALLTLDRDGKIASWNAGAERIKGYRADEILGKHFSIFYPEEDLAKGKPAMELEVAEREGRFEDEGWRVRKDGSRFWASVIISAIRNERGELQGFGKVTRDFTERREAERKLATLNERLAEQNEELVREIGRAHV